MCLPIDALHHWRAEETEAKSCTLSLYSHAAMFYLKERLRYIVAQSLAMHLPSSNSLYFLTPCLLSLSTCEQGADKHMDQVDLTNNF